jgi:Transposase DDE domain
VPAGGWGGATRRQRIGAGLAELEATRLEQEDRQRAAAEKYLAAARDGQVPPGRVPTQIAVEVAQLRLEQALAKDAAADAREAASGRRRAGRRRAAAESAAVRTARSRLEAAAAARATAEHTAAQAEGKKKPARPVRNITDPDSRVMHCTRRGSVQACNCQIPRTRDGVFLLPRITQDPNDSLQVQPAITAIARSQEIIAAGHAAGQHPAWWAAIITLLFDNGYFSRRNIELPGPDRLIGTAAWKDPGPHTPACTHHDPRDQMHHNLATRQGRHLYRQRGPLSEGGFADLKQRTGLRQFALRGLAKAQGELLLACLSANIHLLYRRHPLPA